MNRAWEKRITQAWAARRHNYNRHDAFTPSGKIGPVNYLQEIKGTIDAMYDFIKEFKDYID